MDTTTFQAFLNIEKLSRHVKNHMLKNPIFYHSYYTIVWKMHAAYCFNQLILNVCWRTNLFSYLGNAPVYSPFSDVNMWMRMKFLPRFYWSDQLLNEAWGCLSWTLRPHWTLVWKSPVEIHCCTMTVFHLDDFLAGWIGGEWFVLHTL